MVNVEETLCSNGQKMVRLATQAKNRLHAVPAERVRIGCDLDTLAFAQSQRLRLEAAFAEIAADDERTVLLIQLPGISLIAARTLLAAIGEIRRFPTAHALV